MSQVRGCMEFFDVCGKCEGPSKQKQIYPRINRMFQCNFVYLYERILNVVLLQYYRDCRGVPSRMGRCRSGQRVLQDLQGQAGLRRSVVLDCPNSMKDAPQSYTAISLRVIFGHPMHSFRCQDVLPDERGLPGRAKVYLIVLLFKQSLQNLSTSWPSF